MLEYLRTVSRLLAFTVSGRAALKLNLKLDRYISFPKRRHLISLICIVNKGKT